MTEENPKLRSETELGPERREKINKTIDVIGEVLHTTFDITNREQLADCATVLAVLAAEMSLMATTCYRREDKLEHRQYFLRGITKAAEAMIERWPEQSPLAKMQAASDAIN